MSGSKSPNRDTVTTINKDGSRFFIHPADVSGKFTTWRRLSALLLIGIYVLLPWIKINGYPAVFLDVLNRRFHLFGITLAAQDMWLLFFLVSGLAFLLFYITAFLCRVCCGCASPQTVFLEHVFRRVERWLEGDSVQRKKLDRQEWDGRKLALRVIKQVIFVFLAAVIAHIFLSYFVSIPQLWLWMTQSPLEHWKAFVFVFVITGALYFNFAWFREQLCIVICPYGRFQSALIDDHSYNVAYDYNRGNPPGPVKDNNAGDCIDCHRCVQVCPTGIDIRQGLQMECIGCAACIDACNDIMVKVNRPKGLIRYASDNDLERKKTKIVRPRTILYTLLLLLGVCVAGFSVLSVEKAAATITRMPGSPFYVTENYVRNQYQIRLINKNTDVLHFSVNIDKSAIDVPLELSGFADAITLTAMEERNNTFIVQIPRSGYKGSLLLPVEITIEPGNIKIVRKVEFLGPDPALLNREN